MSEAMDQTRTLHRRIKEILLLEWDPIGITSMQGAQDEYDSYIPMISAMLIARKLVHEVFEYLLWVETQHMGLASDRQRTQHVAEMLVTLSR